MSIRTKLVFAGIFLIKDEHILLLKRIWDGKFNWFRGVPGGHVNVGEKFSQSAMRELREETGIYISQEDLSHEIMIYGKEDERDFIGYYGFCTQWWGAPINNEPNKCSRLAWFKKNAFPRDITPFAKKAFEGYEEWKIYLEVE